MKKRKRKRRKRMSRKILIAEDVKDMSDMMRNFLTKAGYTVYQAYDGAEAVVMARKHRPDLILLDIMMPKMDGYQVCTNIRLDMHIPIIIVTAVASEAEKLRMFELGADDYLTKPFSFNEMVSRVNAQLRRYFDFQKPSLGDRYCGELKISIERGEASVKGEGINLSAKELKLLDFLTLNANQIFNKQRLIDEVWGIDEYIDEAAVAMTVSRLRDKLAKHGIKNIVTVWGFGYKWQD